MTNIHDKPISNQIVGRDARAALCSVIQILMLHSEADDPRLPLHIFAVYRGLDGKLHPVIAYIEASTEVMDD